MNHAIVTPQVYWASVNGRSRTSRRAASRRVCIQSHSRTVASDVAALGLMLAGLQILDGLLTALGMMHFGTSMEGNLFLRMLMHAVGYVPAIIIVKSVAVGIVCGLCLYAYKVTWLKPALKLVIVLYVTFAVLPWSIILAQEYFV